MPFVRQQFVGGAGDAKMPDLNRLTVVDKEQVPTSSWSTLQRMYLRCRQNGNECFLAIRCRNKTDEQYGLYPSNRSLN